MFTALGCKVTLIDGRPDILPFCDREIVEALTFYLRDRRLTLRLGERVTAVEEHASGTVTRLESGKLIAADVVLYSPGRRGAVDGLGLDSVGITPTDRLIEVGESYRTSADHIWAVGDVIGFPSLAASSAEQGRVAALDAFGHPFDTLADNLLPFGIYAIPEISFVGKTEEELTEAGVPYEVGVALPRACPRSDHGRHTRHAEADGGRGRPRAARRPRLRPGGDRAGAHRAGRDGPRGKGRLPRRRGLQLPHAAEAYKVAALDASNRLEALKEALAD